MNTKLAIFLYSFLILSILYIGMYPILNPHKLPVEIVQIKNPSPQNEINEIDKELNIMRTSK